jgi:hypothetical protein
MEEVNKFYEWMLKMGNIHLADNQQMSKAFEAIASSNAKAGNVKTQN